jgi:hypothetical protein
MSGFVHVDRVSTLALDGTIVRREGEHDNRPARFRRLKGRSSDRPFCLFIAPPVAGPRQWQAGRRVHTTTPLAVAALVMVIVAYRLKTAERWVWVAALVQRHAMMNLDSLDQAPLLPAWLAQVVDGSELSLA